MNGREEPGAGDKAATTEGRWHRLSPLLLAAVYLALIPLLIALENVPRITYLLVASAVVCLLVWSARYLDRRRGTEEPSGSRSSTDTLPPLLSFGVSAVRRLPPVILWLPLPVSLSWLAAEMSRVPPAQAD